MLKEGDKAPDFTTVDSEGNKVSLSDLKGKTVVLYFYPKDDTPGCTVEACGFRDHNADFAKRKAVVFGVSKDPAKSHEKFRTKFKLPFPLLMDEDLAIAKAYGAWGEKKFMGRKYMGIFRITFVIGQDGRIVKAFPKVTPKGHAEEILAAL